MIIHSHQLTKSQNKELEATEERKRKAKQLELQRKEMSRSGRTAAPRAPSYPTYTPPPQPVGLSTYDSYEAEKNKSFKLVHPCEQHTTFKLTALQSVRS